MAKFKVNVNTGTDQVPVTEVKESSCVQGDGFAGKAVTIGAVVAGAALIEAELIPGIIIGAAATIAPKYVRQLEKSLHPLLNSTVRGVFKLGRKVHTAVSEIGEHMSDIAAEVKAEETAKTNEISKVIENAKA